MTISCFFLLTNSFAQGPSGNPWTASRLDSLLKEIRFNENIEAAVKSKLADSAFTVSQRLQLPCKALESRILQSFSLDAAGMADSALAQLLWVNTHIDPKCTPPLKWRLFSALTNVYLSLGEYARTDSLANLTLQDWQHSDGDEDAYLSILTNGAISKAYSDAPQEATTAFHFVLSKARMMQNAQYIQKSLVNLSSIKGMMEEPDSAYYFLDLAAKNVFETKDMDAYMALMLNLSLMEMAEGRYKNAESRLDSTNRLATTLNNLRIRVSVLSNKAYLEEHRKRYDKAYGYLREYIALQDSSLNAERIKAVAEMMEKYESEKKARQIEQLKVENLDAALRNERIRHDRNRYIYIGVAVVLIAIGLLSRLRYIHKAKAAIQKEKDIAEGLLLNILPATVAEELKISGKTTAKRFEPATILFSDFKGFTETASMMEPEELVQELNICFQAFDFIITDHGLEKIKTIGDAYMAGASIPEMNTAKAADVLRAAADMMAFIVKRKVERDHENLPAFSMRIGIHTGPVVAGIVGVKKFQYDLWGDTVNIASRMETHGEVNKINISASTYEEVKDLAGFTFTPRGMIDVKGKGHMVMYFAEPTTST